MEGVGTEDNVLYANKIGADVDGDTLVPNHNHGVGIYNQANNNAITSGSAMVFGSNLIVGNGWSGVAIVNSHQNGLFNNAIGTNVYGHPMDLGNQFHGVVIVGGSENYMTFNRIAFNGKNGTKAGVMIDGSSANMNWIKENSIHDNTGEGIELINGGNNGISKPLITLANCDLVTGIACAGCRVEVFSDFDTEGRVYEGWTLADPDVGVFSWTGDIHGPNVTVTMRDASNNTSEFSLPWEAACPHSTYLPVVYKHD
jgi:hypothetical protein